MKKKDFTFVITTFNSEKIINNCLKNLPVDCKKIIIENSGNNLLKSELEKRYDNLDCFVMKENLGYGKANNFGIKKSQTKYIFILNPDVALPNEKFEKIINELKDESFAIASPVEKSNANILGSKKIFEVNEVKGFAMIIDREVALSTPFDENIFLYLEEIDMCNRVRENNGRILLVNIEIDHLGGASHGNKDDFEMEKSRNWHWMWSKFYYFHKNSNYIFALIKTLPNLFSSLFKYLVYEIVGERKKKIIYKMRILGLLSSYKLQKSYYRPYNKIK